ncbi:MAG: glycosyltransferase [Lachnospiraceae bacterium]|nr:glycosyltransferase [Lachnospiraceae bacterium]
MGGISKIGAFISKAILSNNRKVICCSLVNDNISVDLSDKVNCYNLGFNLSKKKDYIGKIQLLYKLRKLYICEDVELVVALGIDLARIAYWASKGLHIKIIASERGNPYRYSEKDKKKYFRVLKHCNCIVVQNKVAYEYYKELGVEKYVIGNPAELRFPEKLPTCFERKKNIVSCGRLDYDKNFELLIRAFSQLVRMGYSEYQLKIYGNGTTYQTLSELINTLNMNAHIQIITSCHNVFRYEYDAGIFVLPSRSEGMPNALIEALSLGIPCIATDCPGGGVRELLENGELGVLIPDNDEQKLCQAMKELIDNPKLAEHYGRKGKIILEKLNPNNIAHKWNWVVQQYE